MKKLLCLSVLCAFSGWAQESTLKTPPTTITAGGSVTSINQAITNAGSGGTVWVLPGDYYISNNAPVYVLEGRTLQAMGKAVFHVDTNGPDAGRLNFSTFQLFDNSTVRGITWEATNTWDGTDAGGHPYASFAMSGYPCTNALVDRCDLQGGSDVFYSTNATPGSICIRDSRLTTWWDFFSTTYGGPVISINCEWTGNGTAARPSRMNLTQAPWIDIASTFNGFAGMDATHAFPTAPMMFGSVLKFVPASEDYISKVVTASAGSYLQQYTNADGTLWFKAFSLSPDKSSYMTNATTTNRVYAYNKTNIYVTAGSPDATINGTYVLGTTDGDFTSGLSFWTNQSHAYFVLRLNDPANITTEGSGPTFGIFSNNVAKALGAVPAWSTVSAEGANVLPLGDDVVTCTATLGTNSIVTNMIPTLYSAIFNQALAFIPTNGGITTLGTNKFVGNGAGLTNLPSSEVGVTDGSSATAGNVGQVVSSLRAVGSATGLSSGVASNVVSISLTAGDWDVTGNINFVGTTATASILEGGINTTSLTLPTDGSEVFSGVTALGNGTDSVTVSRKVVNVSSTTVVYLVGKTTFSVGTVAVYGSINARRVR